MKRKIAILLTCFNRKGLTQQCLKRLQQQNCLQEYQYQIFLVDDGTDGTGELVNEQFNHITVIKGNGNLYWSGGMRLAFSRAMLWEPDFYIWLNDDSILYDNAIASLIEAEESAKQANKIGIIIGSMQDAKTKLMTYGGKRKTSKYDALKAEPVVPLDDEIQPCDLINGNLVLIPKCIVDKVGNISEEFTHGLGDYDYGLRAIKAGFSCWVAPGFLGSCSNNVVEGSCKDSQLTVSKRVALLSRPTGLPPAKEWMLYTRRHGGYLWPLFWCRTLIRQLSPKLWVYFRGK